jgi:hypothetical protein
VWLTSPCNIPPRGSQSAASQSQKTTPIATSQPSHWNLEQLLAFPLLFQPISSTLTIHAHRHAVACPAPRRAAPACRTPGQGSASFSPSSSARIPAPFLRKHAFRCSLFCQLDRSLLRPKPPCPAHLYLVVLVVSHTASPKTVLQNLPPVSLRYDLGHGVGGGLPSFFGWDEVSERGKKRR